MWGHHCRSCRRRKGKCWAEVGTIRRSHLLGSLICVLISGNATVGMWRLRACVCVSRVCDLPWHQVSQLVRNDRLALSCTPPPPIHQTHPIPPPCPPICSGNVPNLQTCHVFTPRGRFCVRVCACACSVLSQQVWLDQWGSSKDVQARFCRIHHLCCQGQAGLACFKLGSSRQGSAMRNNGSYVCVRWLWVLWYQTYKEPVGRQVGACVVLQQV